MVFNATFNNISVIYDGQFYLWMKPECTEKTTDLSQVTPTLDIGRKLKNEMKSSYRDPSREEYKAPYLAKNRKTESCRRQYPQSTFPSVNKVPVYKSTF
jgi:hypothetical protein